MATKQEIIEAAFSELGLAGYASDMQPEETQDAMKKLDRLMAMWAGMGIRIGYSGSGGDVSDQMQTPAWADDAIALALAIRVAPSFGKTPSMETKIAARVALTVVQSKCAQPGQKPIIGYSGAGYGGMYSQLRPPVADIQLGNDSTLDFMGDY